MVVGGYLATPSPSSSSGPESSTFAPVRTGISVCCMGRASSRALLTKSRHRVVAQTPTAKAALPIGPIGSLCRLGSHVARVKGGVLRIDSDHSEA